MDGTPSAMLAVARLTQYRIKLDLAPGHQGQHKQHAEHAAGNQGQGH